MNLNKLTRRDVLIVDDDKDICEIMGEYCRNMGCFKNIVFAHDGTMASQKMRNQKFALILLDVNMPKKSGADLIGELDDHSLNQRSSVVIVSGTLEKEVIARIISQGVKTFLVKPFDEPTFQDRAMKALARQK